MTPAAIPCNTTNEGVSKYEAELNVDMIWICKSKNWTPYR